MDTRPLFPSPLSLPFLFSVIGCTGFWIAAYVLIVRRGFKDKACGMPVAALCGNITWEALFSHVYKPDYRLVEYGNTAWVVLDVLILYIAWKHGPEDFKSPLVKRWLRPMIVIGIGLSLLVFVPFANVYKDTQGYFLGWADAFAMSILFIAMLIRRDSLQGQSFWIAVTMFFGNVSAFFWVMFYPKEVLDPQINLAFLLATGFFNVVYIGLVYAKCRELGINPWTNA